MHLLTDIDRVHGTAKREVALPAQSKNGKATTAIVHVKSDGYLTDEG